MEETLAVQTSPHVVEAPPETTRGLDPEDAWDLTAAVAEWALAGLDLEKEDLLIALIARNCPGSDTLSKQIEDYWDSIAEGAYVVKAVGGDLVEGNFTTVKIGDVTFGAPGVPFLLLLGIGDTQSLQFRALGLGPFSPDNTRKDILDFLSGRSRWVQEAETAEVVVVRGRMRLPLGQRHAFHAALSVNLPVEEGEG